MATERELARKGKSASGKKSTRKSKKQLTVAELQKKDAVYEETKEVVVDGYTVHIKKKFRPTDIDIIVEKTIDVLGAFDKFDVPLAVVVPTYIATLMLKYFSDIDIPDDFDKQITVMKLLIDHNLLRPLVDSFDEKERKSLEAHVQKTLKGVNDFLEKAKEQPEQPEKG